MLAVIELPGLELPDTQLLGVVVDLRLDELDPQPPVVVPESLRAEGLEAEFLPQYGSPLDEAHVPHTLECFRVR